MAKQAVKKLVRETLGRNKLDEPPDLVDRAYEEWRDENRQSSEPPAGFEDYLYEEYKDLRLFREAPEAGMEA